LFEEASQTFTIARCEEFDGIRKTLRLYEREVY